MSEKRFSTDSRLNGILKTYEKKTGIPWSANLDQFEEYLLQRQREVAYKTWRWQLRVIKAGCLVNGWPDLEERVIRLLDEGRKSQRRRAAIPEERVDLENVLDAANLIEMGRHAKRLTARLDRKYYSEAFTAFTASVMTGLRPIEWSRATLFSPGTVYGKAYKHVLRVETAKTKEHQKDGDGSTPIRHLILDHFEDRNIQLIRKHLANVQSYSSYKAYNDKMRVALQRVVKDIDLPPATTLYTARHLFVSECRRAGMDARAIAAVLGHTNVRSQMKYGTQPYIGEARKFKVQLAQATPEAVAAVVDDRENH